MAACKQTCGRNLYVTRVTLPAIFCLVCGPASLAPAPAFADLGRFVRAFARVGDDVPLGRIDDVATSSGMRRAARELMEESGTHIDDAAARNKAVRKAFDEVLSGIDSQPLRQQLTKDLARLDPVRQEAALLLARGSKHLADVVPDVALRSRLVREGGGEVLAAIGRFDDLADDAVRFDLAVSKGAVRSPAGIRKLGTDDFGRFFLEQGKRGHRFWTVYVRPHWKLWLAGTALAAVMIAPDEFLDAAGNITEHGIKRVGELGGEVLAHALTAAIEASGNATKMVIRETTQQVSKTFFSDVWGIPALALLLVVVVTAVPITRRYCVRMLSRLFRRENPQAAAARQHEASK
ncbi:MAG: hypothetical protein ACUVTW_14205 [Thermogutta sp.]